MKLSNFRTQHYVCCKCCAGVDHPSRNMVRAWLDQVRTTQSKQNLDIAPQRPKPSEARPSRNPSPLHPPCLPHELSAPLSGLVSPAPPLPPASPAVTLPLLPPARPTSLRLPSSVSTEHTPALWYDSHDFNWSGADDAGMELNRNGWEPSNRDDLRELG